MHSFSKKDVFGILLVSVLALAGCDPLAGGAGGTGAGSTGGDGNGGGSAGDGPDGGDTGQPVPNLQPADCLTAGAAGAAIPTGALLFPPEDIQVAVGEVNFIWSASDLDGDDLAVTLLVGSDPDIFDNAQNTSVICSTALALQDQFAVTLDVGSYFWGIEITDGISTIRRPTGGTGSPFEVAEDGIGRQGLENAVLLCPTGVDPARQATTFNWLLGDDVPLRAQIFVSRTDQANPFEQPLRVFEVIPPTATSYALGAADALPLGETLNWGLRIEGANQTQFTFEGQLGAAFTVAENVPPSGQLTGPANETAIPEGIALLPGFDVDSGNCEDPLSLTFFFEFLGASGEPEDLFNSAIRAEVRPDNVEADLVAQLQLMDLRIGRWAWGIRADDGTDQFDLPDSNDGSRSFRTFILDAAPQFVSAPAFSLQSCEAAVADALEFSFSDENGAETVDVTVTFAPTEADVFTNPQTTLRLDGLGNGVDAVDGLVLVQAVSDACASLPGGDGFYGVELNDGVNLPVRATAMFDGPSEGACCALDGSCTEGMVDDCDGVFQGDGTTCETASCPSPVGACCQDDGSCAESTEADCSGVYLGDETACAGLECPLPLGACCLEDGSCAQGTADDCNGAYQGDGSTCGQISCPEPPRVPDCNGNGIDDALDISNGTSLDCNTNAVPDECDIAACETDSGCQDCDQNGVPDECDIAAKVISQIITSAGDGGVNGLDGPQRIAIDHSGNVFLVGRFSNNAFKITSSGIITEIITTSSGLDGPRGIAVDSLGNVYVAGGISDSAFKVTPAGLITEIIDSGGDGANNGLEAANAIAVGLTGNVFVAGSDSDNAFKVTPSGVITEVISASDGLDDPRGIATDISGNIYVAGRLSDNAFKISPAGVVTQIIDGNGDGAGNTLREPFDIAVDVGGNVYVSGGGSNNVFKITSAGIITVVIDETGDGLGNILEAPRGIAVDAKLNIYVVGRLSNNAFKITPDGGVAQIVDQNGGAASDSFNGAQGVAVDLQGRVYVTGSASDNAFVILPGGELSDCNSNGIPDECEPAPGRLFVDSSVEVPGDGTSWAAAFDTLTEALATAVESEGGVAEIWVASGRYTPAPALSEDRTSSFELVDGVALRGGFTGNEVCLSDRIPTTQPSVLSGDIEGNDFGGGPQLEPGVSNFENSVHVVTAIGVGPTTLLEGFTISGGNANIPTNGLPDQVGGGIYMTNSGPTISDCTVEGNFASESGGGMYIDDSSPTITQCDFNSNGASSGGGIFNESSSPALQLCTFAGNFASFPGQSFGGAGGGMMSSGGSPTVTACEFLSNFAEDAGGGISVESGNVVIVNSIFRSNEAGTCGGGGGGGLRIEGAASATVSNCTFTQNFAGCEGPDSGGGIHANGSLTMANTILWGNNISAQERTEEMQIGFSKTAPIVSFSCIEGLDTLVGNSNIGMDPLFGTALELLFGSPCIDVGNNSADIDASTPAVDPLPGTDFDGAVRIQNGGLSLTVDMGALEHAPTGPLQPGL